MMGITQDSKYMNRQLEKPKITNKNTGNSTKQDAKFIPRKKKKQRIQARARPAYLKQAEAGQKEFLLVYA